MILTYENSFAVTGLPIPRFVTIKSAEVNLRKGPNSNYPILVVYKRKGYPLEVIAEFENWRKLKDYDGMEGWVHENMISGNRNVAINNVSYNAKPSYASKNNELILFQYPNESSYPLARAELGVIAKLKKCRQDWCMVKIDNIKAWVKKSNLWGVFPDEIIN
jgi:SH3-like domain-containing protein